MSEVWSVTQQRSAAPAAAPPRVHSRDVNGAADSDPLDEFFWREDETAPSLEALVAAVTPAAHVEPPEVRREWLIFRLGHEEYAVEIDHVREILRAPTLTEVPRAPEHVLGVIMVRGDVVAVFDPRRRLALRAAVPGRQARVLVCDAGEGPRGLLVDSVSQVVRLPASAVEPCPATVAGAAAEYIRGIGRDRGRMFLLLDLRALIGDVAPARAEEAP